MPAVHDSAAKIAKNRCLQARTVYHRRSHFVHPLRHVGYARVLSLSTAVTGSLVLLPVRSFAYPGSGFAPSTRQFKSSRFSLSESKGHSFRIGAASVAAAAGLPDWLIKVMGRWSSDCYQLYIRTPISTIESIAPRMANIVQRFSPN